MFCSHCGTYLERDLEICPYCREGQQGAIEDIESHNKEKLKQICPDINNLVTFNFMGYKYTFDSCYSRFINAYRFWRNFST